MKKLFSSDGIRGSLDSFPFDHALDVVAKSIAQWQFRETPNPCILFISDTRNTSWDQKKLMMEIVASEGVDVVDAGILPTAAASYLIKRLHPRYSCGVVITGSHNPLSEGGIKIFNKTGLKINTEIENEIEKHLYEVPKIISKKKGKITLDLSLARYYVYGQIENIASIEKKCLPKFVIDFAHGAASLVGQKIFSDFNCVFINKESDGNNTNVNSGSEYYRYFPEKMVDLLCEVQADFGITFDGDGDRVVLIDKGGNYFDGDIILGLLAVDLKKKSILTNDTVVATPMSNSGLENYLHMNGIKLLKAKNGDKYITELLISKDIKLGGEQIGHIIIKDKCWNTGDSIRTSLFLLNLIAANGSDSLEEWFSKWKKWPQVNISVFLDYPTDVLISTIPKFMEIIENVKEKVPDISLFECRPASTEPVYRIMLEAKKTGVNDLAEVGFWLGKKIQNYFKSSRNEIHILDCSNGGHIDLAR